MKRSMILTAACLAAVPALTAIPAQVLAQGTGTPMTAEPATDSGASDDTAATTMPKADDEMTGSETEMASESDDPMAGEDDTDMASDTQSEGSAGSGAVQMTSGGADATMPLIRAESVEEATVYSLSEGYDETFWDSGEPFGPVMTAWDEIGAVEDLVLDNAAQVVGVTVDVGGFLGIGESTVLIPLDEMRLVQMPEDEGFFVVTRMSHEQLKEAEAVDNMVGDD